MGWEIFQLQRLVRAACGENKRGSGAQLGRSRRLPLVFLPGSYFSAYLFFPCVGSVSAAAGGANAEVRGSQGFPLHLFKNYIFQFYNNLPKRHRPWLSPELTGSVFATEQY